MEQIIKKNMKEATIVERVKELSEGDVVIVSKNCSQEQIDLVLANLPEGVRAYQPTANGRKELVKKVVASEIKDKKEFDEVMKDGKLVISLDKEKIGTTSGKPAFGPDAAITGKKEKEEKRMKRKLFKTKDYNTDKKEEVKEMNADKKPIGFLDSLKKGWNFLKEKVFKPVVNFIKKESKAIALAAGATVAGGAVASTATGAFHIGLAILAVYYFIEYMRKKITAHDVLVRLIIGLVVGIALPYALYAAFIGSVVISSILFAAPYVLIVG